MEACYLNSLFYLFNICIFYSGNSLNPVTYVQSNWELPFKKCPSMFDGWSFMTFSHCKSSIGINMNMKSCHVCIENISPTICQKEIVHMSNPKIKSSKRESTQSWIKLNPWNNSDEKKGEMNSQEFSILAEPDESWHSFCVHYQEITSGSHVDFAAATGLPRSHSRACSHPIFKYLGRWGGITDHIVGGGETT